MLLKQIYRSTRDMRSFNNENFVIWGLQFFAAWDLSAGLFWFL